MPVPRPLPESDGAPESNYAKQRFFTLGSEKVNFFHIGCILKITLAVEFSAIFYKLILKLFFFRRYVFCQIKPPRYKFLDVYLNSLNVTLFVEVLVKGFDIVICISS